MRSKYKVGDVIPFTELPSELRDQIILDAASGTLGVVVDNITFTSYGLKYPLKDQSVSEYIISYSSISYVDNPTIHDYIPKVKYISTKAPAHDFHRTLNSTLELDGVLSCEVRKDTLRDGWYQLHFKITKVFPHERVWREASVYIP